MHKISAVIITKNEEKSIERCLRSIEKIVDEIIIVDSNSTDGTESKVKAFKTAEFISHPWAGYSKTKNFGNTRARFDWILSLDADEELSEELQNSILETKNNLNGVYAFARLTNYCGAWIRHCNWYPDYKIRLFNRSKANWSGDVHEQLEYDKNHTVCTLKGDCYHYSVNSIEAHLHKVNQYSSLWAKEAYLKGKRATIFQLIFKPPFSFFKTYFIQLGFMDGYYGFVLSVVSGISRFLRISKLFNMKDTGNS